MPPCKTLSTLCLATLSAALALACVSAQDAPVQAARELLAKHQDAVVWVSASCKMKIEGTGVQFGGGMFGGSDMKAQALGTVIHPSGLTVVAYSDLDKASMFGNMSVNMDGEEKKFQPKVEITGVKLRLADNTEVPAQIVLKDEDLDLAFIRPDAPKAGDPPRVYAHLALDQAATAQVLDQVVALARLDQNLDRQPTVALSRIEAVVKKPRAFYTAVLLRKGGPVFTLDGKLLGLAVQRKVPGANPLESMGDMSSFLPVILPTADVKEVADQALKAK
jgi:hypothetical protein